MVISTLKFSSQDSPLDSAVFCGKDKVEEKWEKDKDKYRGNVHLQ